MIFPRLRHRLDGGRLVNESEECKMVMLINNLNREHLTQERVLTLPVSVVPTTISITTLT